MWGELSCECGTSCLGATCLWGEMSVIPSVQHCLRCSLLNIGNCRTYWRKKSTQMLVNWNYFITNHNERLSLFSLVVDFRVCIKKTKTIQNGARVRARACARVCYSNNTHISTLSTSMPHWSVASSSNIYNWKWLCMYISICFWVSFSSLIYQLHWSNPVLLDSLNITTLWAN